METERKRKPSASLSLEQLGGQVTTRSKSKKDSEVVLRYTKISLLAVGTIGTFVVQLEKMMMMITMMTMMTQNLIPAAWTI